MTPHPCIDPEVGRLLHAYELNTLDDQEVSLFEAHLLNCDHCFEEAFRFETEAQLLACDPQIRTMVKDQTADEKAPGFANLPRRLLSPKLPMPLRPAILIIVILLLLYPAYLGIVHRQNDSAYLYPIGLAAFRSTSVDSHVLPPGNDVVLSLACPACDAEAGYALSIVEETGRVAYDNPHFTNFDKYGVGRLYLSRELLTAGLYTVTVTNAQDTRPMAVYRFRIQKSP